MNNIDMKLLMESWKSYTNLIETSKDTGDIYLLENKKIVKRSFNSLLERFDNGDLTEDQLYKRWHRSMLYEHKLLSEELGINWEKEGEMVNDPDYKPPHERGGLAQKAKDWMLEKSIQIFQMAKRGVEGATKAASGLIEKAKDLASEHPTAAKVATVVALSLAMFALMAALDSDSAQAAIKAPDAVGGGGLGAGEQGQISDTAYETLRGLVHQSKETDLGGTGLELRAEAMNIIDAAQAAGDTVDFSTLETEYGKFANEQLKTLDGLVKLAREGDTEAAQWLENLAEVGKKAVYKRSGVATR